MRSIRPEPLYPEENGFKLAQWIKKNLTIIERHGAEWVTLCPRCNRPKMAVHVYRKAFQCLSAHCRFRGWHPSHLVAEALGIPVPQARETVAALALGANIGPVGELVKGQERHRTQDELPQASLPPVDWQLRPPQRKYAQYRGISDEHARLFGLGTVLSDGSGTKADYALSGRILFPVWNRLGTLVWWVARAIGDSKAKTINMPRSCREIDHPTDCFCYHDEWGLPPVPEAATADEVVLGLHLVEPGQTVYVVEGPIDAAVCGPGFVATMRAWISPQQIDSIVASGASNAVILFDGDEAGRKGMRESLPLLQAALPARGTVCPPGEDPGSLRREKSLQVAAQAETAGIGQLSTSRYTTVPKRARSKPLQAPLEKG